MQRRERRGGKKKNLKNSALPGHENDSLLRRESPIGRTAFQRTRFSAGYRRPTMERMEHWPGVSRWPPGIPSFEKGRQKGPGRKWTRKDKKRSEKKGGTVSRWHSYTNYGNDPIDSLFLPSSPSSTFERRNAPLSTFRPIARATPDTSFCYFDPFCNGESANTFVKWITATRGSPLLEGGRFRREARICLQIRRNFF